MNAQTDGQTDVLVKIVIYLQNYIMRHVLTLEFQINVPVRLLISGNFSRGYDLIWEDTFIKFELLALDLYLLEI